MVRGDISTVCRLLNLTATRVYTLATDGVIERPKNGQYDLLKTANAYIHYLQTRAVYAKASMSEEKTRLAKAQAERVEIENAASRGELIRADIVMDEMAAIFVRFRTRIQAVPRKIAPIVAASTEKQAQDIIENALADALGELYTSFAPDGAESECAEGHQATGSADSQPVVGKKSKSLA